MIWKTLKQTQSAPDEEQVELCKKWILEKLEPAKGYHRCFSYRYKHMVERNCGKYIGNLSFVKAMEDLGFEAKAHDTHNALFKAKPKFVKTRAQIFKLKMEGDHYCDDY